MATAWLLLEMVQITKREDNTMATDPRIALQDLLDVNTGAKFPKITGLKFPSLGCLGWLDLLE